MQARIKQERPTKDITPLSAYTYIHFKELRRKIAARWDSSSQLLN